MRRTASAEFLSGVEVSLAWPSIARSFGATGRFVWRGEAFDVSASAGDLFAVLTGDRSGLKVRLAGAPFKVAFDGHMSNRPALKLEGTRRGRRPLAARGCCAGPGGSRWTAAGFGLFALKAQMLLSGGSFALSQVNIELDGNAADGVLAFSSEPRMTVKGTLAAEQLDLTPYVSTIEVMRTNERDWSRQPIAIEGFADFDLDLRLSAARITIANAKFGRTGVAANLRDGRLTIAIGEAQAFGGVLRGSLLIGTSNAGTDVKSLLQFSDVDLDSCLGDLFGIRKLEGKGDLALALEASGDSVFALTRTLAGTATLVRAARRAGRVQCRATAAAAGAAAALDRRRFPPRPHAVRQARRHAADRAGHRHRRGCARSKAARCGSRSAASPRSRRASST